jgi:hypothetical protein
VRRGKVNSVRQSKIEGNSKPQDKAKRNLKLAESVQNSNIE